MHLDLLRIFFYFMNLINDDDTKKEKTSIYLIGSSRAFLFVRSKFSVIYTTNSQNVMFCLFCLFVGDQSQISSRRRRSKGKKKKTRLNGSFEQKISYVSIDRTFRFSINMPQLGMVLFFLFFLSKRYILFFFLSVLQIQPGLLHGSFQ